MGGWGGNGTESTSGKGGNGARAEGGKTASNGGGKGGNESGGGDGVRKQQGKYKRVIKVTEADECAVPRKVGRCVGVQPGKHVHVVIVTAMWKREAHTQVRRGVEGTGEEHRQRVVTTERGEERGAHFREHFRLIGWDWGDNGGRGNSGQ